MFIKKYAISAIFAFSILLATAYSSHAARINLIDFVVLNPSHTLEERNEYEIKLAPIAAKYGAKVIHSYDITAHLAGPMKQPLRISVWDLPDQSTFEKVGSDPDYKALIAGRDLIHNMKEMTLYFANEIQNNGPITHKKILVDLVVMQEGYADKERNDYEEKMAPLASKYGFEIAASYNIQKKLGGTGPEKPLRLNLWQINDPKKMDMLSADPDYMALAPQRNKIHDFSNLSMFFAQPRS